MILRAILWLAVSTTAQAEDEKTSLPQQEADARALAKAHDWQVVDVLRVPGHSRDYIDIYEAAADMEKQNIPAMRDLLEHFKKCDFDVLVCRDSERFARTQAMHATIVESVVRKCGARIYSLADGWVDETNFRMFIAMAGYKAASDLDRLVKARKKAMEARAAAGLTVVAPVPFSHLRQRDPITGREIAVVLNEQYRRLWDDLAYLFVEKRTPYRFLEHELFALGHTRPDGRRLPNNTMYRMLNSPDFWGHRAMHFMHLHDKRTVALRRWVWDETVDPPEGTTVYRNVIPPVYTGQQAEAVKAELLRRALVVKGRARSGTTYRFSQLVYCEECSTRMGVIPSSKIYLYMHCNLAWRTDAARHCSQRGWVPFPHIQEVVTDLLQRAASGESLPVFQSPSHADSKRRTADAQKDLARLTGQITTLIREQSTMPESAQGFYRAEVARLSEQATLVQAQLDRLEKEQGRARDTQARQAHAVEKFRDVGAAAFWQLPDGELNQLLLDFFGDFRLFARDREIVGLSTAWQRSSGEGG